MDYNYFDENCRKCRTSPTAVVEEMGLSKGNLSNWQRGGNPSADVLSRIAIRLGCSVDGLLGIEKPAALNEQPESSKRQRLMEQLNDVLDGHTEDELVRDLIVLRELKTKK